MQSIGSSPDFIPVVPKWFDIDSKGTLGWGDWDLGFTINKMKVKSKAFFDIDMYFDIIIKIH